MLCWCLLFIGCELVTMRDTIVLRQVFDVWLVVVWLWLVVLGCDLLLMSFWGGCLDVVL